MEENIENILLPEGNKLIKDKDGVFHAQMMDAELDVFSCEFNGDDTVTIDTSRFQYLILTRETLEMLLDFIDKVEDQSQQD